MCYHPSYRSDREIQEDIAYFTRMEREALPDDKALWRRYKETAEREAAKRSAPVGAAVDW